MSKVRDENERTFREACDRQRCHDGDAQIRYFPPLIYTLSAQHATCLHNGPVTVIDTLTECGDGQK